MKSIFYTIGLLIWAAYTVILLHLHVLSRIDSTYLQRISLWVGLSGFVLMMIGFIHSRIKKKIGEQ